MCIHLLFAALRARRAHAVTRGEDVRDSIVLVGSSNFSWWRRTQRSDLPGLPVVNRAVAGWTTADVLAHADALLSLSAGPPRVVVYYAGSNDLRVGSSPAAAAAGVAAFADRVPAGTRLVVVASFVSPDRASWASTVRDFNARCAALCALALDRRVFIDANPELEGRGQLFRLDGLHLNAAGYATLGRVLHPVLARELAIARGEHTAHVRDGTGHAIP